ncbi:MAG: hypothetical protein RJB34_1635 [Pseudomonadota bacterium]|jgi:Asp/Glu/hydantoin racemase
MALQTQKHLLIINPNTSVSVSEQLQTVTEQALAGVQARVSVVTAAFGAAYIASEVACAVAGHATVAAWQDWQAESNTVPDGILIGCFGDPGLFALREISSAPVTGLAEAAFNQAHPLGSYAIVTGGKAWESMLWRLAQALPCGHGLADIETVDLDGAALRSNPDLAESLLIDACHRVLKRSPVQSIIIGGAGLAGFARRIQLAVAVPLIDSVEAGVQALFRLSANDNKTS